MNGLHALTPGQAISGRTADDLLALRKREWAVLAVLLSLSLGAYGNLKRVVIHGISMYPTYHTGQSFLVWTTVPKDRLKPGDVIVFRSPDGDELMKRIVYIRPGPNTPLPETVRTSQGIKRFDDAFNVYLQGVLAQEVPAPKPDQTIFVMGDNYDHSSDSRDFGPIAPSAILGKVIQ
jgi:signal peptidase I